MGMSENQKICKIVEACLGVVSALLMVEIVAIMLVVTIVAFIVALGEDRILEYENNCKKAVVHQCQDKDKLLFMGHR